jgi:hypothetical protein
LQVSYANDDAVNSGKHAGLRSMRSYSPTADSSAISTSHVTSSAR